MAEISAEEFDFLLSKFPDIHNEDVVGVAVSGGPDSMALTYLLSRWAEKHGKQVLAVSVDHGLRPEARAEAEQVGAIVMQWPCVAHQILSWVGEKPETRILEEARAARYELLADFYKTETVRFLFLAHHLDDQAETFLIRLCKGSGLDGLSGMRLRQLYKEDDACSLTLLRPLLSVSKEQLIATCDAHGIDYVRDPSNENESFLRPRLREARAVLEAEGLSNKRLANTAGRLARAREALDEITDTVQGEACRDQGGGVRIDLRVLERWPEEIGFRVFLRSLKRVGRQDGYGPRLEKVESLFDSLMRCRDTLKETLGGCIVTCDRSAGCIIIQPE